MDFFFIILLILLTAMTTLTNMSFQFSQRKKKIHLGKSMGLFKKMYSIWDEQNWEYKNHK